jgi:hypothetical protein
MITIIMILWITFDKNVETARNVEINKYKQVDIIYPPK